MTENVTVTIHSTQAEDDQTIRTSHAGTYCYDRGLHIISFEEYADIEENTSGTDAVTSSLLRIDVKAASVTLIRSGATTTEMVFQKNRQHTGIYRTPYGSMQMLLHTHDLSISESDEKIEVIAGYSLCLNGTPVSDTNIHILIRS